MEYDSVCNTVRVVQSHDSEILLSSIYCLMLCTCILLMRIKKLLIDSSFLELAIPYKTGIIVTSNHFVYCHCRYVPFPYLFIELVSQSMSHHCLSSPRRSMKQHHHTSPVGDSIIQTHPLTTPPVGIKVANCA